MGGHTDSHTTPTEPDGADRERPGEPAADTPPKPEKPAETEDAPRVDD